MLRTDSVTTLANWEADDENNAAACYHYANTLTNPPSARNPGGSELVFEIER
jgi:hypothetical protein